MRPQRLFFCLLSVFFLSTCQPASSGKHLFILSGQSNMARLDPNRTFIPTVADAFGAEDIIVVKSAQGGQPIKRWYRDWKNTDQTIKNTEYDLYDSLMVKVNNAILEEEIASVTFLWMQGERDARQSWGEVYEESLHGLYQQLSADLGRDDIYFVIGRLSDFDMGNERYPHWTKVREAQVSVANSSPNFSWINTDDLNDGINQQGKEIKNDLHLSEVGYAELGRRFAEAAIEKIQEVRDTPE
ncbi:MAG TPA: sialate O-acetylesterase [Saprospiraceae bacterium]|nr:sialate O-acetylesterase [Saprospiraceae bacterium]